MVDLPRAVMRMVGFMCSIMILEGCCIRYQASLSIDLAIIIAY